LRQVHAAKENDKNSTKYEVQVAYNALQIANKHYNANKANASKRAYMNYYAVLTVECVMMKLNSDKVVTTSTTEDSSESSSTYSGCLPKSDSAFSSDSGWNSNSTTVTPLSIPSTNATAGANTMSHYDPVSSSGSGFGSRSGSGSQNTSGSDCNSDFNSGFESTSASSSNTEKNVSKPSTADMDRKAVVSELENIIKSSDAQNVPTLGLLKSVADVTLKLKAVERKTIAQKKKVKQSSSNGSDDDETPESEKRKVPFSHYLYILIHNENYHIFKFGVSGSEPRNLYNAYKRCIGTSYALRFVRIKYYHVSMASVTLLPMVPLLNTVLYSV
jgi:hypothetical protein